MLAADKDRFLFDFVWQDRDVEGLDEDMDVDLSVPDKSRYFVSVKRGQWESSAKTLRVKLKELLATPPAALSLVADPNGTDDPKENRIEARGSAHGTTGIVIGQHGLPGARNFWQRQNDPGRDAALMQLYLSQIPANPSDPASPPCYDNRPAVHVKKGQSPPPPAPISVTIDGKWTDPWIKALGVFAGAYAKELTKKPEIVARVAAEYKRLTSTP